MEITKKNASVLLGVFSDVLLPFIVYHSALQKQVEIILSQYSTKQALKCTYLLIVTTVSFYVQPPEWSTHGRSYIVQLFTFAFIRIDHVQSMNIRVR